MCRSTRTIGLISLLWIALILIGCKTAAASTPTIVTGPIPVTSPAQAVKTLSITEPPPTQPSEPSTAAPAAPTSQPPVVTAAPAEPVTATASQAAPVITRFTVDPVVVQPGASITLSWESQGSDVADISTQYFVAGSEAAVPHDYTVPPGGTLTIQAPAGLLRQAEINLHVATTGNAYSNRTLFVHSPCPVQYFFPFPSSWGASEYDNCPDTGPKAVQAVEQDFEHGRMIWVPAGTTPSMTAGEIASLPGNGMGADDKWLSSCWQGDDWQAGQPESDPSITPPPGLFQPVRGFGKLWRDGGRDKLGWALAPEQSYTAQFQVGDVVWSPYNDSFFYIGTADSRVAVIHCVRLNTYWQLVPQ